MPAPIPTVIVTRPQPQADAWVQRLQALGQAAQALPLLRIEAVAGFAPAVQQAWTGLATEPPVGAAARWAMVMFVSPNAVLQFFAQHPAGSAHTPHAWPAQTWAAATGPGTAAALLEQGVPAGSIVQPHADSVSFDAESLWRDVLQARDWRGLRVLIVRGETGRDWLADTLQVQGAEVQRLAAYRQAEPQWLAPARPRAVDAEPGPADQLTALLEAAGAGQVLPVWLFSSSQAIAHLLSHAARRGAAAAAAVRAWPVLATHPRIAQTARNDGFLHVLDARPDPAEVTMMVRSLHLNVSAASLR